MFPIYLKLPGDKSFYKINSEKQFEELVVIGELVQWFKVDAVIYPDLVRIKEMIENKDGLWVKIDQQQFEDLKKKVAIG